MLHPLRFFKPVESLDAETARKFIRRHGEGTFAVLDVRQPAEYEKGHIPGARLFPMSGLLDSLGDLDRGKPTLVYCSSGGRSRFIAQVLASRGFQEVYHLEGGINAWEGRVAKGPADFGLSLVHTDDDPAQVMRSAYGMEESMAVLYRNVAAGTQDGAVKGLLLRLATVEDRHKTRLLGLIELDGPDLAPFKGGAAAGIIEGGFGVRDFLSENKGFAGAMTDILDLSMTLETQALDLYLRLARRLENARAREVLFEIADEEKGHLAALAALRDERA